MLAANLSTASRVLWATRRSLFTLSDLYSLSPLPGETQKYHEQKILPYKRSQLYDIVADVDSYRSFVPFCIGSRILQQVKRESPDVTIVMDAELTVGFLSLKESYVSKVTCQPYQSVEAVASSPTLFKNLVTTWRFESIPQTVTQAPLETSDQTLVTLDLAYAFANPLHAAISTAFFGQISKLMIQAFEARCSKVYKAHHV